MPKSRNIEVHCCATENESTLLLQRVAGDKINMVPKNENTSQPQPNYWNPRQF
jgi:hypothetical protein